MTRVFVGVGSNIDPMKNVVRAFDLLSSRLDLTATSRFYVTEPIGRPEQHPFANGVWCAATELGPAALKALFREIEAALGRVRGADAYAARSIDLDLLLYGDAVIEAEKIPDPHILARPFLAAALLDIEPGLALPGTGRPLAALVSIDRMRLPVHRRLTRIMERRIDRERKKGTGADS